MTPGKGSFNNLKGVATHRLRTITSSSLAGRPPNSVPIFRPARSTGSALERESPLVLLRNPVMGSEKNVLLVNSKMTKSNSQEKLPEYLK